MLVDKEIALIVNDTNYITTINEKTSLADILRINLGLKGTKIACNQGHCGACSVLLNGRLVKSCIIKGIKANGKRVTTIEGLINTGELHPLQKAFLKVGAVQCGYCTPGMILTAKSLIDKNPEPDEEDVKEAIYGNLCRCTGYIKIIEAVLLAAQWLREADSGGEKNLNG